MKTKSTISIISNTDKITYKVDLEIKNNKINYKENKDNTITEVLYDRKNKILIRDNKEMYMEYDFNMNNASIYIKDLKKEINLDIKVKKIKDTNNKIDIEYILNDELYKYVIDME